MLGILRNLAERDQLWLPHRVAFEYHKQRPVKIIEQIGPAKRLRTTIVDAAEAIGKARAEMRDHPFIDWESMFDKTCQVMEGLADEMLTKQEGFLGRLTRDTLRDEITETYDGRVGPPYSRDSLKRIYEEGKTRYQEKVPPGFGDSKSHGGEKDEPECYGDLVIWNQLIAEAKLRNRSIVFVTDDWKKGDWFWVSPSRSLLGPRPELVDEMFERSGKRFHVARSARFTEWMSGYLKRRVSAATVAELEDAQPVSWKDMWRAAGEAVARWQGALLGFANSPGMKAILDNAQRARVYEEQLQQIVKAYQDSVPDLSLEFLKRWPVGSSDTEFRHEPEPPRDRTDDEMLEDLDVGEDSGQDQVDHEGD